MKKMKKTQIVLYILVIIYAFVIFVFHVNFKFSRVLFYLLFGIVIALDLYQFYTKKKDV